MIGTMLLQIFNRKSLVPQNASSNDEETKVPSEFLSPLAAKELLATPRRQKLLAHIWQRTSVSRTQFETLYQKPIERYAELVQQFPASESHHHAYAGGMLDHGLEIMAYALKLRQSYLLPIGSTPEEQAAQAESWTACAAYAALLHDIGKIAVDLHVEYENEEIWHPWHGMVTKPYRFKYHTNREYRLHSACTGLLYRQILNVPILDWLSKTPDLWSALLYVLAGQFEYAGVLGEIVTKADQASVAQELGGDPAKAMTAPKHALQRKLLDGLRYLVKEELKLNNAGPSDGWLTDDALWLVSKTVSDKLRAHLLSQGISGIPSKNSAIFDVMQEHSLLLPTPENKAIWSATVTSGVIGKDWSNTFTFLKISPALIWESGQRPEAFNGTVIVSENPTTESNTTIPQQTTDTATGEDVVQTSITPIPPVPEKQADSLDSVFDLLGFGATSFYENNETVTVNEMNNIVETPPELPPIEPISTVATSEPVNKKSKASQAEPVMYINENINHDATPSGEHFMDWLKSAILNRKLIINDAKALVHTVEDTLFIVTPGIFNRYIQEFPQVQVLAKAENLPDWRWAQKQFEKLKQHKKQSNGLNIWTCTVSGPHKTNLVHGYLLEHPELIIVDIVFNNPYLKLKPIVVKE